MDAIYHSEGRITPNGANWQYEYSIKDHLGNTRITFADLNNNKVVDVPEDILQENHYYPFGMNMNYAWLNNMAQTDSKYQYNGKELNEDFGLNLYAYGFRYYDASIARFISVDPLAKKFPYLTTYQYASGDPVKNIDLDGLEGVPYNAIWNNAGIYNEQQGIEMIEGVFKDVGIKFGEILGGLIGGEIIAPIVGAMLPEVEIIAEAPLATDMSLIEGGAVELEGRAVETEGVAAETDATATEDVAGKRFRNRLDNEGKPNSMKTNESGTTTKKYGPDGKVQKEYNKGHQGDKTPKVEKTEHVHDYKPANPKNPTGTPERQPGRPPKPNELKKDEVKIQRDDKH